MNTLILDATLKSLTSTLHFKSWLGSLVEFLCSFEFGFLDFFKVTLSDCTVMLLCEKKSGNLREKYVTLWLKFRTHKLISQKKCLTLKRLQGWVSANVFYLRSHPQPQFKKRMKKIRTDGDSHWVSMNFSPPGILSMVCLTLPYLIFN